MTRKSFQQTLENALQLKEFGQTTLYLAADDPDLPWAEVTRLERDCYVALVQGLEVRWPRDRKLLV